MTAKKLKLTINPMKQSQSWLFTGYYNVWPENASSVFRDALLHRRHGTQQSSHAKENIQDISATK